MSGARGPRRPVSVARLLSERARAEAPEGEATTNLGGLLDGLKGLVEGLGKLAETAGAQQAGGERRIDIGGQEGRVVFGYAVRTLDGAVQAFGHVPEPRDSAAPAMPEARQPLVDVFEEEAAILVVAEVPGLDPAALTLSIEDGALVIAGGGRVRYRRVVALPGAVEAAAMTHACRNGILEVRLPRAGAAP
jgi:HSP20 family protein